MINQLTIPTVGLSAIKLGLTNKVCFDVFSGLMGLSGTGGAGKKKKGKGKKKVKFDFYLLAMMYNLTLEKVNTFNEGVNIQFNSVLIIKLS